MSRKRDKELIDGLRQVLLSKTGGLCWYCGDVLTEITIDHVDCAGGNGLENLVPACRPCNSSKRNYGIEEFRRRKSHPPFKPEHVNFLARHGIVIPKPDYVFWFERRSKFTTGEKPHETHKNH